MIETERDSSPAALTDHPDVEEDILDAGSKGIYAEIAALPPGTLVTEVGLAGIMGKCTASIKAAVERGEFPRPVRLMGKNTWTAGSIIRHHEDRLEAEARRYSKLRP